MSLLLHAFKKHKSAFVHITWTSHPVSRWLPQSLVDAGTVYELSGQGKALLHRNQWCLKSIKHVLKVNQSRELIIFLWKHGTQKGLPLANARGKDHLSYQWENHGNAMAKHWPSSEEMLNYIFQLVYLWCPMRNQLVLMPSDTIQNVLSVLRLEVKYITCHGMGYIWDKFKPETKLFFLSN